MSEKDIAHRFFSDKLNADDKIEQAKEALVQANGFLGKGAYSGNEIQILCSYVVKSFDYDKGRVVPLSTYQRAAFAVAMDFAVVMCSRGVRNFEEIMEKYRNEGPCVLPEDRCVRDAIEMAMGRFKDKVVMK